MRYSNKRSYRDFDLVIQESYKKEIVNKPKKTVFTAITKILKDVLDLSYRASLKIFKKELT